MGKSTQLYLQPMVACYEEVLQSETELTGTLKVILEIDDTGKVTGVETDPKGGAEGIAAVATCVDKRFRDLQFPGRSKAGKTAVVRVYEFSPKAS
jgi:hypothetical protein